MKPDTAIYNTMLHFAFMFDTKLTEGNVAPSCSEGFKTNSIYTHALGLI